MMWVIESVTKTKTLEDISLSVRILQGFILRISVIQEIVKAIVYHNLTDQLPVDITTFQMSVRDCDDIDRFDMIRTAIIIGDCVREKNNMEIMELCRGEINKAKWVMSLQRGTKTAKEMMNAQCMKRISLLEDIVKQAQKGFMAERIEQ